MKPDKLGYSGNLSLLTFKAHLKGRGKLPENVKACGRMNIWITNSTTRHMPDITVNENYLSL